MSKWKEAEEQYSAYLDRMERLGLEPTVDLHGDGIYEFAYEARARHRAKSEGADERARASLADNERRASAPWWTLTYWL